jgi:hypothetical protein
VFAVNDVGNTDYYKNDRSSPIKFFSIALTVVMNLQKLNEITGEYESIAVLNDNTYGTYRDLRIKQNIRPVGYYIQWQKVLLAFGIGEYRLQWDYGTGTIETEKYCLEVWSPDAADETVRVDMMFSSIIGDENQEVVRDFEGVNWFDQVRICNAIFGYPGGSFERETVRQIGGFERPFKIDYKEEYTLVIKSASSDFHKFMRYTLLMADSLKFTDYNSANLAGKHIDINCQINSEYRPNFNSVSMPVNVTFIDGFNNRRKLYA